MDILKVGLLIKSWKKKRTFENTEMFLGLEIVNESQALMLLENVKQGKLTWNQ